MESGKYHAWTLESLQASLAERGHSADFSSVFRAAEKLASEGAIVKVLLDDGRARFELKQSHHDHLHCTLCDALIPLRCVIGRAVFADLEAEAGVAISEHRVIFSGLCPHCRAEETAHRDRRR